MGFVHDQFATGGKLPVLTVAGTFSRYVPVVDARFSYRGENVVETLDRLGSQTGDPKTIPVDQSSDFVSRDMDLWAYHRGVTPDFSCPGKPTGRAGVRHRSADSGERL
jgi:putative transposase